MKILFRYLRPYKWLVALVLTLAAVNMGFSLFDPIIFGKLVDLGFYHQDKAHEALTVNEYLWSKNITYSNAKGESAVLYGVGWLLLASITVAMISRIAKAFQDYFLNK